MRLNIEQASICPHCIKKGMTTQTFFRVKTESGDHSHCGTCGWLLPNPVFVAIPEDILDLVRNLIELQHMRMDSPLRANAPWDLRWRGEGKDTGDHFIRLTSRDKSVFIQLIWREVTKQEDVDLYIKDALPASIYQDLANKAPQAQADFLNLLIEQGFVCRFLPHPDDGKSETWHAVFYKRTPNWLMIHAECAFSNTKSKRATGEPIPGPLPTS